MATAVLKLLAKPLQHFCRELLYDLPEGPQLSEEQQDELEVARRRLAALWVPDPDGDRSTCMAYQWPASRLSAEDMRKLHELKLQTGKPITVLLHEAVSVMYELMQSDMVKLQELRNRTGHTYRELLGEAVTHLWDAYPPDEGDATPTEDKT